MRNINMMLAAMLAAGAGQRLSDDNRKEAEQMLAANPFLDFKAFRPHGPGRRSWLKVPQPSNCKPKPAGERNKPRKPVPPQASWREPSGAAWRGAAEPMTQERRLARLTLGAPETEQVRKLRYVIAAHRRGAALPTEFKSMRDVKRQLHALRGRRK